MTRVAPGGLQGIREDSELCGNLRRIKPFRSKSCAATGLGFRLWKGSIPAASKTPPPPHRDGGPPGIRIPSSTANWLRSRYLCVGLMSFERHWFDTASRLELPLVGALFELRVGEISQEGFHLTGLVLPDPVRPTWASSGLSAAMRGSPPTRSARCPRHARSLPEALSSRSQAIRRGMRASNSSWRNDSSRR